MWLNPESHLTAVNINQKSLRIWIKHYKYLCMKYNIEPINNAVKQKLYGALSLGSDIGPSESHFCSQCKNFDKILH